MDAGSMIDRCFRHQNSKLYGRVPVPPDYPKESLLGAAETCRATAAPGTPDFIPPDPTYLVCVTAVPTAEDR